jgi:hypothetical protein
MHAEGPEWSVIEMYLLLSYRILADTTSYGTSSCCESLSCTPRPEMDHSHCDKELSDVLRSHNWEYSVPWRPDPVQPLMQNHPADRRHAETVPRPGFRDVQYLNMATLKWPVRPVIRKDARAQACGRLHCVVGPCF